MITKKHPSKHRVMHVVSELRPGGVEIRLLDLMKYLGPEAVHHTVVTVSGKKGPLAPQFESLGVRVKPQKMRSMWYPFVFIWGIHKDRSTAVQSYLNQTSGLQMALAWVAGCPQRIASFRSDGLEPRSRFGKFRRGLLRFLINRFATDIIGVSPSTLEKNFPRWRSDVRCQVLVNGFNLEDEWPPGGRAETSPIVLSTSLPIIAHVGRADVATKNRERAITIAATLKRAGQPHRLIFIGRHGATDEQAGDNLREFQSLAQRQGVEREVEFLGEQSNVRALLRQADCLLVTSTLEGLPGVIVEALIEDTPVVSTNLPGSLFLQNELEGIKCLSLEQPDSIWARTITSWVAECREPVIDKQLSKAVDASKFNIKQQALALSGLWTRREN